MRVKPIIKYMPKPKGLATHSIRSFKVESYLCQLDYTHVQQKRNNNNNNPHLRAIYKREIGYENREKAVYFNGR